LIPAWAGQIAQGNGQVALANISAQTSGPLNIPNKFVMTNIAHQNKNTPFLFKQNSVDYRIGKLRNSLYRRLTRNEPEIKTLIEHYADAGYSDFLIDIGANIGLTSVQSGRKFKELHLYEPNPACYNILKVNTNILLAGHNYHIHEFGLGETSNILRFCIPHNNWGGAFVMSDGNAYSEQIQAAKDGHKEFDRSKYSISEVRIEPAESVMQALFDNLSERNLNAGIIKIDVEGYELTVLNAISKTLPAGMKAVVIFENWSDEINFSAVLRDLRGRGKLMKLVTIKHPIKILPRWINTLLLLIRGSIDTVLMPSDSGSHVGGLVLEISSADDLERIHPDLP
jgi:FkbM family methyltransferase